MSSKKFHLTLPEQLLKYLESFIKAPAPVRSKYTAGITPPLLDMCMCQWVCVNHKPNSC